MAKRYGQKHCRPSFTFGDFLRWHPHLHILIPTQRFGFVGYYGTAPTQEGQRATAKYPYRFLSPPSRPETEMGSGGVTCLPIKSPILLQTIFQKNPLSVIRPEAIYVVVTFSLTHKGNLSMVFPHQSKLLSFHPLSLRRKSL